MAAIHPRVALARTRAKAAQLSRSVATLVPAGDRLPDALARLETKARLCRFMVWSALAELRAAACGAAESNEAYAARCPLRTEFAKLTEITARRRRALRTDGLAEAVYEARMRRSERAAGLGDFCRDRAEFEECCLCQGEGEAACEEIAATAELWRCRTEAWDCIARLNHLRARGIRLCPDLLRSLREFRTRAARLRAAMPALTAAARAESEAATASWQDQAMRADDLADGNILCLVRPARTKADAAALNRWNDDVPF
jgi:hypothetical protein